MTDEEYKEKAWMVIYVDLVFAENPQEAFSIMNDGVNNTLLPVGEAIELGDSKDYPILPVEAKIDGAMREKLDALVQEFSAWVKGQKVS